MPSGSVDLGGKIIDATGNPKAGLTVSLYEAATWEAAGAATATDTSDADGLWNFDTQDITKTWIVVAVDGSKKTLIDARNKIQLTNIDIIDDISVDTIYEHTAAAGVTIDGVLLKDGTVATGGWAGTTIPVNKGGTGVTASTGTVAVVLSTSPTLVTPLLGTPTSGVLTNCTGLPAAAVLAGSLGTGAYVMDSSLQVLTLELGHATDTTIARSAAGAITVEGVQVILSGAALGTPASGTVTNLTGTASININGTVGATTPAAGTFTSVAIPEGVDTLTITAPTLTAARAVTFGDFAGEISLLGNVVTGTGNVVRANSPTLVTPALGTPASGTLTSCTGLPVAGITASTATALGVGSVELGHATDTTLSRSAAGVLAVEGIVIPSISSTNTLTNKTLDASVASGTWTASGTWIIPAVTLGGTVDASNENINRVQHLGLGNQESSANWGIIDNEIYTFADDGEYGGYSNLIYGAKTSAAFTASMTSTLGYARLNSTNTQNWTNAVGLRGLSGFIRTSSASGILTGAAALMAITPIISAGVSDAIITNYYGVYVGALPLVANSRLVNNYGIYVGAQAGGGTLNYAIYTAGGEIRLASADPLHLGVAGASTGKMEIDGATSGTVTLTVAAIAGTWTMTLPTAVGTAGFQLTDAAGDGITSWAAAASRKEWKNILDEVSPRDALDEILGTKTVYRFTYKEGFGTGDYKTKYVGVMADEAPWAMHFNGNIVNPVNSLGYMVLGFQATHKRIDAMGERLAAVEEANRILRGQLEEASLIPKA